MTTTATPSALLTFETALYRVVHAHSPEELFGTTSCHSAKVEYRRLARALHPDAAGRGRHEATDAFGRLTQLWEEISSPSSGPSTSLRIVTRRHSYQLGPLIAHGELADLYSATYDDTPKQFAAMKWLRNPRNTDLMEAEVRALKTLSTGEVRLLPYVPKLLETFRHRQPSPPSKSGRSNQLTRRVTVTQDLIGFVNLAQVRSAYPYGLDPRDAMWMWRRLLVAIGFAHRLGLVHGCVTPEHVLILPSDHGLVLVDWCYSVEQGQSLRAISRPRRDLYPRPALAKQPVSPSTDIYMATKTISYLMGPKAPPPLRAFINGCTLEGRSMSPSDAWETLAELDELGQQLYGPRRFRPFTMPAGFAGRGEAAET